MLHGVLCSDVITAELKSSVPHYTKIIPNTTWPIMSRHPRHVMHVMFISYHAHCQLL